MRWYLLHFTYLVAALLCFSPPRHAYATMTSRRAPCTRLTLGQDDDQRQADTKIDSEMDIDRPTVPNEPRDGLSRGWSFCTSVAAL